MYEITPAIAVASINVDQPGSVQQDSKWVDVTVRVTYECRAVYFN